MRQVLFHVKRERAKRMWTRHELKQRAKNVLRWNYWKSLLISFVLLIAGGRSWGGNIGSFRDRDDISRINPGGYDFFKSDMGIKAAIIAAAIAFIVIILVIIVSLGLRIFLGYPLEVGGRRFFVRSAEYTDNSKCFSFAFAGENYMGIVKTMLLKGVMIFLWTLLFIIPGIIKSYAYSMVPYILSDNPNIGAKRALQLSEQMTRGHKFDIFVLELSFLGWYLLGVLALVVGTFFVMPYEDATKAELYLVLRQNALDSNMCTYAELGMYDPNNAGF